MNRKCETSVSEGKYSTKTDSVIENERKNIALVHVEVKAEKSDDEVTDSKYCSSKEMDWEGLREARQVVCSHCGDPLTSSSSEQIYNYKNHDRITITLERDIMSEVKLEQTGYLHADHKVKEEMVMGPAVVQAANCGGIPPKNTKSEIKEEKPDLAETEHYIEVELTPIPDFNKDTTTYIPTDYDKVNKKTPVKLKNCKKSDVTIKKKTRNPVITPKVLFTCNDCGEQFASKCKLLHHILTHENIKHAVYFKCKECTYQTVTQDSLERHEKLHNKERQFACDVCGYRFKDKFQLQNHSKICKYNKLCTKIHECTICSYTTNCKSNLVRHIRIHTGIKPFSCSLCTYKCAYNSDLTKHLRIHTGEKLYSCTVCQYKCAQKSHLTEHLRAHTGGVTTKPYSCYVCEFKCVTRSQLKNHLWIHTDNKPFSCSKCEHKCISKSKLTEHFRTHTGEKPHSCPECDYRCISKSDLTKHARVHSGDKPYCCSLCSFKCSSKSNLNKHTKLHNVA